jgi:hypothetical protein
MDNLPSNLVFYFSFKAVNINGHLHLYNIWLLQEGERNIYLVNWKTGKSVLVFKDWNKYQKVINKNINNLQSLLDLYHGDNECVMLANAILGVDDYIYTMRNIIARLI